MRADAVEVSAAANGARLRLRVKPGGRHDRLVGAHGGALKLEVRAAPERGRANAAVEALIASVCGVARGDVRVITGHTSQDKVVEIEGPDGPGVCGALAAAGIDAVALKSA